jgi:NAD(P)H-flavin reductase
MPLNDLAIASPNDHRFVVHVAGAIGIASMKQVAKELAETVYESIDLR